MDSLWYLHINLSKCAIYPKISRLCFYIQVMSKSFVSTCLVAGYGWRYGWGDAKASLSNNLGFSLYPQGSPMVGYYYVYTVKFIPNAFVQEFKGHLVTKEFFHIYGVWLLWTFSHGSSQLHLYIITLSQLKVSHDPVGYQNTFLYGGLHKKICMECRTIKII